MARSIVNELFDRLIESFPAHRTYAADDFTGDPMPPPVAHFLKHLLEHQAAQAMPRLQPTRPAWIDTDHADVREARSAYRSALRRHAQFPQGEWTGALRRALQRVTAYLIHPTQTLTHFVFGNQDKALPPDTIRERVRFFSAYSYLHEAIERYLKKNGGSEIDRDRFESFLQRVDAEMTADYDADQWLSLLQPLFNLVRVATPDEEVPTPFLHTFFEEKQATTIARRLQRASVQSGTTTLSPSDLRQLISSDTAPAAPSSPAPVESSSSPQPDAPDEPTADEPERVPEPAPTSDENQPTPLWKQFRQGNAPTTAAAATTSSPEPEPTEAPSDEEQPLWRKFRPDANADDDAPAELTALEHDVLGPRGSSNRDLFIRKLFEGDRDGYVETLKRLREAPSWSRASQIIAQDIFRAHQVNIYSDPAVTFTNAVEERFRNS